jgi:ComF family protein
MPPRDRPRVDHRIRRRIGRWLDGWVPRGCALCRATLPPGAFPGVCFGCLADLPGAHRPRCTRCAQPTDREAPACTACATLGTPPIDTTVTVADYAPPLDRLVTALKFGRELTLARPLGELLAARWLGCPDPPPVDCLVPVPLAPRRLARRGFNQSLEVARAMATALAASSRRMPVATGALGRLRESPPQSGLALAQRRTNLQGAFACTTRFDGMAVGIVDDVMTSGSTVGEVARVLRAAGAVTVVAFVVARTP